MLVILPDDKKNLCQKSNQYDCIFGPQDLLWKDKSFNEKELIFYSDNY